VARIEVSRHVAADPASVALLLAEPANESGRDRGLAVVAPPRRSGVGFIAAVEFTEALGRVVAGDVTVEPAAHSGCEARIVFAAPDGSAARGIERAGTAFLDGLAARARSRSFAA
jgi:hypothetical protein